MENRTIHVLLIEDNPGDATFIRRLLTDASGTATDSKAFTLTCVETLARGLDFLQTQHVDVVLLDLLLPDSHGLGTLTSIQTVAPAVPIVVLTGLADQDAALAAVQNGAQDYLVKGRVDPFALANSIRYARERKHLLEKLRRYSLSLEERNADLDAFAHTVAHDLKNHVFAVVGNAEILIDAAGILKTAADEKLRHELLEAILRSGHKMTQVIEGLLLLGQVRRSDVERTPVDMGEVIDEVQARIAPLQSEGGGVLIVGDPAQWPTALGYAPWIEEIWYNYISNAFKYGGCPPRVELSAERQADQQICFSVRDNGPGLNAGQMELLFGEFIRLHGDSTRGHGLGLSIVKRIVDKLGGEVGVQSRPGVGSIFSFTLPAASLAVGETDGYDLPRASQWQS